MDLVKSTKAYIKAQGLLKPGDVVLAAVSGGMDSIAMADILIKLKGELDLELAFANFNHHLRPEAEEEAGFVGDFARRAQIPVFLGGADIARLAQGGNIQDIARKERYAYLRALATRIGADAIAVAHHADDQAETLLLHLMRGSGLSGLAAMSPSKNKLIRPLLFASRANIAAYIAEQQLEYREDASNAVPKYLRNKIRLALLPALKSGYNPHISESLNATADICRAEDALLDDLAENALAELWLCEANALHKPGFDEVPVALQRRLIRKAYTLIMGDTRELNFKQVEAILGLKDESCVDLPGGLKAYLRGNIYFAPEKPPLPEHTETLPVIADGLWHKLSDWNWEYQAAPAAAGAHAGGLFGMIVPGPLVPKMQWRTRRPGGSIFSAGKKGRSKLKDIFIENHIPIHHRNDWPLLTDGGEVIWLCGLWQKDLSQSGRPILIKVRRCDKI